jgi:sugar-specific transcriptional regulator TrmB
VEVYITIEGAQNIMNKFRNILNRVEERVYVSCTRNYLLLIVRELDELMDAGKKVVIITDQPASFGKARVYVGENKGMQIGVIADSRYVLTGEYGEGSMNSCLYSGKKNFVELYKNALANEIKLLSIQEEKEKQ